MAAVKQRVKHLKGSEYFPHVMENRLTSLVTCSVDCKFIRLPMKLYISLQISVDYDLIH